MVKALFHEEVASWFRDRFGTPTEVQTRAWPIIATGEHVLLTAPTGTGKTLAAFLWAIDRLVRRAWGADSIRVVYVSPLKALNNDIRENLISPLADLQRRFSDRGVAFPDIRVHVRSGDTPQSERRRLISHPAAILITTPESLNLMLSSPRSRELFTGVQTVILDEIHAVAGEKRGTHLMLGVERLGLLAGDFQRVALSATVQPLEEVGRFVAGSSWSSSGRSPRTLRARPIRLISVAGEKQIDLAVRYLPPSAERTPDDSVWQRIADEIRPQISPGTANLIFVNSRRLAERLSHLINTTAVVAFAHHGSLAKELRLAVEKRLKAGGLRAIVATSSLEMGIDIGDLDSVFLIETPFSVSSAIQRLGRSGHGVGRPSVGLLYASHGRDLIDALVLTRLVKAGDIEPLAAVEAPLDVLAQVLVAMIGINPWQLDKLFDFIRTCSPYRKLARSSFDGVVEMLAGRYRESRVRDLKPRIFVDSETGIARGADGSVRVVYSSGGTIPDRGYFRLALADSNATIGELDEEFVWERRIGDTFTLGTQGWKIASIDHQKVAVVPHKGPIQMPPFWKGEGVSRGFHLASRVSTALEAWDSDPKETLGFDADSETLEKALDFLKRQRAATGVSLPHRHHIVIEETTLAGTEFTQVFVHTFWGNRVNYPCSIALEAMLTMRGWMARSQSENDCIHLAFPNAEFGDEKPADLVRNSLFDLASVGPDELIREHLESTGFFGARFREAAGRALLLPRQGFGRRSPLWLTRLRSKRLAEEIRHYRNFPITLEAWRTCLQDSFEIETLRSLLGEIERKKISISTVTTAVPSPFTEGVVWESMNQFVYTDDVAQNASGTSVDDEVMRAAVFGEERPKLDRMVAVEVTAKLDRSYPGYAPAPGDEFLSWAEERLLLSRSEYERLLEAVRRDHPGSDSPIHGAAGDKLIRMTSSGFDGVLTIESAARLFEIGLGPETQISPEVVFAAIDEKEPGGDDEIRRRIDAIRARLRDPDADVDGETARFIAQWLTTRGAVAFTELLPFEIFGFDVSEEIHTLERDETVVTGNFFGDSTALEVFESGNFERVLRAMRKLRRQHEPAPLGRLAPFLATWQGIGGTYSTERVLSSLEGFAAPAGAWEEYILPARVREYRPTSLDSLLGTTELEWFGAETGRVAFALAENSDLFPVRDNTETSDELAERLELLFPDPMETVDFFTLHERSGVTTADFADELWQLVWAGLLKCDSFEVLRRGLLHKFSASGVRRESSPSRSRRIRLSEWRATRPSEGRWARRPPGQLLPDAFDAEALDRDLIRVVLDRYGIVFKSLLERELPSSRWPRLFRTMRVMELSGEILGGYFIEGIPGLQFAIPEALRQLGAGSASGIFWINAADPASLCGISAQELRVGLPERVASNFIVYDGSDPAMIVRRNGEIVEFRTATRHPDYLKVFRDMIGRSFNPSHAVRIAKIDGVDSVTSPDLQFFIDNGFKKEHKVLTLSRY